MAGRLGLYLSNVGIILVERTLEDYFDLNRRYLKISDTLLFADEQVKFDVIPKYYFSLLPDEFYNLAFVKSDKLVELQSLEEISPFLKLDDEKLLKVINLKSEFNSHIDSIRRIRNASTHNLCMLCNFRSVQKFNYDVEINFELLKADLGIGP